MNDSKDEFISTPPTREKDFLYAVLNLDKFASQNDINERHRALSLIFHPDKQHHHASKDVVLVALKRFLEVQRAYEVLSDSFLREVYDALGEEGLTTKWAADLRFKSSEEIQETLKREARIRKQRQLENLVRPRGRLACIIDASSLFQPYEQSLEEKWHEKLRYRLEDVRLMSVSLKHTIQKDLSNSTKLFLGASLLRRGNLSGNNVWGTVRHQYSPRLSFEAASTFLHPQMLNFKTTYRDGDSAMAIGTSIKPSTLHRALPVVTISLSRRLFPNSLTQGILDLHVGREPFVSLNFISPASFDLCLEDYTPPVDLTNRNWRSNLASVSGLRLGVHYWSGGLVLDTHNPRLTGEWGVTFSELALQVKLGLQVGLRGFSWLFGGSWSNDTSEVAATALLGPSGTVLKLDIGYLQQKLSVPITLSPEFNAPIAFWTVVVPSTALVFGYHFILKPRRRAQRLAYIRAARQALYNENSEARRETESTTHLLRESARKRMQAETSKGGLVIVDAMYGAIADEEEKDLIIDVTIPIQALVRNSQLYIPGYRTKSGIQGFFDPAPFASKSLRIRYLFRGRMHYAEIPDYLPVVLPLTDHIVE